MLAVAAGYGKSNRELRRASIPDPARSHFGLIQATTESGEDGSEGLKHKRQRVCCVLSMLKGPRATGSKGLRCKPGNY